MVNRKRAQRSIRRERQHLEHRQYGQAERGYTTTDTQQNQLLAGWTNQDVIANYLPADQARQVDAQVNQTGKDLLAFQGKIIANAFVAAATAGIGNVAMEVYEGTRVGSVLDYALTTRTGAALTGAGVNATAQAIKNDGKVNWVEVATTGAAGYLGMGRGIEWNAALGASAGVVNMEYTNWSEGKDDNVLLGGVASGVATGIGFGVGDSMTKNWLADNPGTFWPVITGNVVGGAVTEGINYGAEKMISPNDKKASAESGK